MRKDKDPNYRGPLKLLRDVSTRWNSTTLMLMRALRLRSTIEYWYEQNDYGSNNLQPHDWIKIGYLVDLTRLFLWLTDEVSHDYNQTLAQTWLYFKLARMHLTSCAQLILEKLSERANNDWLEVLQLAVAQASNKLETYVEYFKEAQLFYNITLILSPSTTGPKDPRWAGISFIDATITKAEFEYKCKQAFTEEYEQFYAPKEPEKASNTSTQARDLFSTELASFLSPEKVSSICHIYTNHIY